MLFPFMSEPDLLMRIGSEMKSPTMTYVYVGLDYPWSRESELNRRPTDYESEVML